MLWACDPVVAAGENGLLAFELGSALVGRQPLGTTPLASGAVLELKITPQTADPSTRVARISTWNANVLGFAPRGEHPGLCVKTDASASCVVRIRAKEPGPGKVSALDATGRVIDIARLEVARVHSIHALGRDGDIERIELKVPAGDSESSLTLNMTARDERGRNLAADDGWSYSISDSDKATIWSAGGPTFTDWVSIRPRQTGTATLTVSLGGVSKNIELAIVD